MDATVEPSLPDEALTESAPTRSAELAPVRSRARWLLLGVPTLAHVAGDFYRRGERILGFSGYHRLTYLGALAESLVVGALLLLAASRSGRGWRWVFGVLFVLEFTLAFGGQHYFFEQYNAYLNQDISAFAANLMGSVFNQLLADLPNYAHAKLPPLVFGCLLVVATRAALQVPRRVERAAVVLAPLALVAALFIPTHFRQQQASTPDVLYLSAIGGLIRTDLGLTEQSGQVRPRSRKSLPVPKLEPKLASPRNVLLVQLESVRADATCVEYSPDCRRTESTNRLFPNRYPLTQVRALDSCTAISAAVLWGGLLPTESQETLHTWPLTFDYARAAGYHTAYFTSQNMMFGNSRLWVENLGVERRFTATDLDPAADLDTGAPERLLAQRLMHEFETLKEPYFALVQLSNAHFPYYLEESGPQPFQPTSLSKSPKENQKFFNYYLNVVYQQDIQVARFLEHMRRQASGKRTVVVYTSDHGEAFREHNNMGHTYSVLEEEIRVPGWIDAPEGTLTSDEIAALRAKRNVPLTHADLAVTMIDLLGVLDAPGIARFRSKLAGDSVLRPERQQRILPLTNCSSLWSCAFENWGLLAGNKKLEAREWDFSWHCWDLEQDPKEQHDLGAAACPELVAYAKQTFGRLPGRGRKTP